MDGDVDAAQALALGELPTVEDPVEALLDLARSSFRAQRWTVPAGNSALDYYRLVQRIEPRNVDAKEGIASVARAYLDVAAKLDRETRTREWLEQIERAASVGRENGAPEVADEADALRQTYLAELLGRGRDAIDAWERETASTAFEQALVVQPDNPEATRGLETARRVGLPGWTFRDRQTAPQLIVLGKYAMGQREVSVAEFRAFWQADGRARFGSNPPGCRDRESVFRFGKRSWDSPGFAQTASHPAVCVSYPMAQAYVEWLARETGQRYRLPTAAEWRAHASSAFVGDCSANVRDADYRSEFGGRDGVECSDGFAATAPGGSFTARKPGLYDVDGNVREWVSDCAANCRERIVLGASWHSEAGDATSTGFDADTAYNTVGFRVLRELE
jgi:hypothetical protein